MTEQKCCTKCRVHKPLSDFGKAPRFPTKKSTVCKSCTMIRQAEWGRLNEERNKQSAPDRSSQVCRICKKLKEADEFGWKAKTKSGVDTACKPCLRIRDRTRYKRDTAKRKKSAKWAALKFRYGLAKDQWDALLQSQDGKCAICRKILAAESPGPSDRACVDHAHEDGKVRGMLCNPCNAGIGHFMDSSAIAQAAADYLRGHGK